MKKSVVCILFFAFITFSFSNPDMNGERPPENQRLFKSQAVEDYIKETAQKIQDPTLKKMFEICFPNTLDTTVHYNETDSDAYVITGDIDAMWLRDSTNQVMPYIPLMKKDDKLKNMLLGLVRRQARSVSLDPYANAFTKNKQKSSPWQRDNTFMKPGLWERKYEIDSLAAFLRLTNKVYEQIQDKNIFDQEWMDAFTKLVQTLEKESSGNSAYTFQRTSPQPSETLQHGIGYPIKKCGLVHQGFRPSDDACLLGYNIPGNAMMQKELEKVIPILKEIERLQGNTYVTKAHEIMENMKKAIYEYGITKDHYGNPIFAYEVDGFGSQYKMDDANIPSLLSLAYLDFIDKDDQLYLNTRNYVWSENNPFFFKGSAGEGIGGPHAGYNKIWPMSIAMKGITSNNDQEILECLKQLIKTTADKKFMHESFDRNSAHSFTRPWFAWANSLFGELIQKIDKERPHLLKEFQA